MIAETYEKSAAKKYYLKSDFLLFVGSCDRTAGNCFDNATGLA